MKLIDHLIVATGVVTVIKDDFLSLGDHESVAAGIALAAVIVMFLLLRVRALGGPLQDVYLFTFYREGEALASELGPRIGHLAPLR